MVLKQLPVCGTGSWGVQESHYSVFKAARYYRMESVAIDTLYTGEMDYRHLEEQLRARSDKPAIINCNIGTTVKGAVGA